MIFSIWHWTRAKMLLHTTKAYWGLSVVKFCTSWNRKGFCRNFIQAKLSWHTTALSMVFAVESHPWKAIQEAFEQAWKTSRIWWQRVGHLLTHTRKHLFSTSEQYGTIIKRITIFWTARQMSLHLKRKVFFITSNRNAIIKQCGNLWDAEKLVPFRLKPTRVQSTIQNWFNFWLEAWWIKMNTFLCSLIFFFSSVSLGPRETFCKFV